MELGAGSRVNGTRLICAGPRAMVSAVAVVYSCRNLISGVICGQFQEHLFEAGSTRARLREDDPGGQCRLADIDRRLNDKRTVRETAVDQPFLVEGDHQTRLID